MYHNACVQIYSYRSQRIGINSITHFIGCVVYYSYLKQ